ncbi:SCO family protein [Chitinimonas naiadis]
MNAPVTATSRNRRVLYTVIAVSIAPILASYLLYYFWKPAGGLTFGQLLEVKPVPTFRQVTLDGKPASLGDFKGKWLLAMVDDASCQGSCLDTLHVLRQVRLAQGKDMGRVERVWLMLGNANPPAEAQTRADGARLLRAQDPVPLPGDQTGGYYLIDPLGNQVLRYPRSADPVKVIKEIGKLLKNNENLG